MENMTCKHIEIVIHEVERGNLTVFLVRKKRYWAYTVDYILRGGLIYGGKRGIPDAIDFANENSGTNYEVDDVLYELHLCEKHPKRELGVDVILWALYYALYVERMEREEKDRYYNSLTMLISGWIALKLASWHERRDT